MSPESEVLARLMIAADHNLLDAVRRLWWAEAQAWQDTRDRLADKRYVALRTEILEGGAR